MLRGWGLALSLAVPILCCLALAAILWGGVLRNLIQVLIKLVVIA